MHLNNLNKHFKKLQKYDIDYLFNEYNEEDSIFKDAREILNERKSTLSHKGTNEIRKKLFKKEAIYKFLKDKEQDGSLTKY